MFAVRKTFMQSIDETVLDVNLRRYIENTKDGLSQKV
jgi:hypothetical protein